MEGEKRAVEKRIRSMLQLGSKDTFPAGRVVTLWRNERWREMLTRWYGTQLGRETLHNISPCEWMASLQMDGVSVLGSLDESLRLLTVAVLVLGIRGGAADVG